MFRQYIRLWIGLIMLAIALAVVSSTTGLLSAAPAETDTQLPTNAMATNSGVANILAPSDTIESAAQMALPSFNNEHSSLMPSDGSIDVGGDSTAMDGKITPSSDFIFSPISAAAESNGGAITTVGAEL